MGTIGVVIIILLLALGAYLLFFAEEPFVEVLAPSELESVSELSEIELDEGPLKDNPVYQVLTNTIEDIDPGEPGRDNPFSPF